MRTSLSDRTHGALRPCSGVVPVFVCAAHVLCCLGWLERLLRCFQPDGWFDIHLVVKVRAASEHWPGNRILPADQSGSAKVGKDEEMEGIAPPRPIPGWRGRHWVTHPALIDIQTCALQEPELGNNEWPLCILQWTIESRGGGSAGEIMVQE